MILTDRDYYEARATAADDLLAGLELAYSNGDCDDEFETPDGCHYFRLDRYIVRTNAHGFSELLVFGTTNGAEGEFNALHARMPGP